MRQSFIVALLICIIVVISNCAVQAATFQLFSSGSNDIYRHSVTGPGTPTANGSLSTGADTPGKMDLSPDDELFVSVNGTTDTVSRYINLGGTFIANPTNPTISGASINDPNGIRFRNDELFSVNFTNNEVARFTFDGSGAEVANPPFVDTSPEITNVRARGVAFSPSGDRMYVSGCCSNSTNVIAVYDVDGAGLVTHLSNITKSDFSTGFSITIDGLQGLNVSDSGELWLADFGSTDAASEIVRATVNGSGSLTAASIAIPGSHANLFKPLDLTFAPDGELFVANLGSSATSNDGFLSRFTFDGGGSIISSSQFGIADNYRGVSIFFVPPVPEPSSFLLLGLGVLGLVRHTRGRKRRA